MADYTTSEARFAGVGATARGATDASRLLAERLNHWCADNPGRRILDVRVQSTAIGAELHLTAVIVYTDAGGATVAAATSAHAERIDAVVQAEEIVAEAQQE